MFYIYLNVLELLANISSHSPLTFAPKRETNNLIEHVVLLLHLNSVAKIKYV